MKRGNDAILKSDLVDVLDSLQISVTGEFEIHGLEGPLQSWTIQQDVRSVVEGEVVAVKSRRQTAGLLARFEHRYTETVLRQSQRRGQATHSRADHDDVFHRYRLRPSRLCIPQRPRHKNGPGCFSGGNATSSICGTNKDPRM